MRRLFLRTLGVIAVVLTIGAYALPQYVAADDKAVTKENEEECPCGYDEATEQCLPCPDEEGQKQGAEAQAPQAQDGNTQVQGTTATPTPGQK